MSRSSRTSPPEGVGQEQVLAELVDAVRPLLRKVYLQLREPIVEGGVGAPGAGGAGQVNPRRAQVQEVLAEADERAAVLGAQVRPVALERLAAGPAAEGVHP